MLRIEHFYFVLAAFLLYAGWRNLRERRFVHAAFWSVLALLFCSGELILAANKAGDKLPAQLAGLRTVATRGWRRSFRRVARAGPVGQFRRQGR